MEEYLTNVVEQIRCKAARPYVEKELRGHIEDQIDFNLSNGMEREEAVKAAVKDMGDPIETGMSLDKIHRPKLAWGVIVLMAIFTIAAMIFHMSIANIGRGYKIAPLEIAPDAFITSHVAMKMYICGFLIMLAFYFIDYTVVAVFAKPIAIALMLVCTYYRFVFQPHGVYVQSYGDSIFPRVTIIISSLALMYIPVFAGILCKNRNTGVCGIIKSVIWMVVPALYMSYIISSFGTCLVMCVSMLLLITVAICKGWFNVHKLALIAVLWGLFVGIVAISFSTVCPDSWELNYTTNILRKIFVLCMINGNTKADLINTLPYFSSDYVLAYISSTYGLGVGILAVFILVLLISGILSMSFRLKNQLGMMMGLGVGMALFGATLQNVLVNIGSVPNAHTFLPLISAGESNIIVTYALIGIVLSIYKYKSVYPKYVDINMPKAAFDLKVKLQDKKVGGSYGY